MRTLSVTNDDLDLKVVDGIEALAQRCVQHMRLQFGEWLLDSELGVPYPEILGNRPDRTLIERVWHDALLEVEDVTDVTDIEIDLDNETRKMTVSATVHSRFGSLPLEVTT